MKTLDPDQLEVARVLFALPSATGFALAGGSALLLSGTIERPTRDIDAFIAAQPGVHHGDVQPLAHELAAALAANDWTTHIVRSHETFTRLEATRQSTTVEIDLAVDSPPLFPIHTIDGLPVLAPQDLAARKILAILDRAEGRDFTDLHTLSRRFQRDEIVAWAQQLDAGLTTGAIADSFAHLHRLDNNELPTDQPDTVREVFAAWALDLRRD